MEKSILRLRDVKAMVGLSRSSIYNAIAKGTFPKQISLGERSVGWLRTDVEGWINDRVENSRGRQ
jgi:prophage regulatory protein